MAGDDFETVRRRMETAELGGDFRPALAALDRIEAEVTSLREQFVKDGAEVERLKRNHNDIVAPMVHDLKAEVERLRAENEELRDSRMRLATARADAYAEVERLRADLAFLSQRHELDTVEVERLRKKECTGKGLAEWQALEAEVERLRHLLRNADPNDVEWLRAKSAALVGEKV